MVCLSVILSFEFNWWTDRWTNATDQWTQKKKESSELQLEETRPDTWLKSVACGLARAVPQEHSCTSFAVNQWFNRAEELTNLPVHKESYNSYEYGR